eukprot:g4154.t1
MGKKKGGGIGLGRGNSRFKRKLLDVMKDKSFFGKGESYRKNLEEKALTIMFQPSCVVTRSPTDISTIIQWMVRFPFYKKLSSEDRLIFAKHMEYEEYDSNDILLDCGDPVRYFHICTGSVALITFNKNGQEDPKNKLWKGEIYGREAAFQKTHELCPWRMRATEKTKVLTMRREFYELECRLAKIAKFWKATQFFHGFEGGCEGPPSNPGSDADSTDSEKSESDEESSDSGLEDLDDPARLDPDYDPNDPFWPRRSKSIRRRDRRRRLRREELEDLREISTLRSLVPNETIYKENSTLKKLYIVGSGEIVVSRKVAVGDDISRSKTLFKMREGEILGSSEILRGCKSFCSKQAYTNSEILEIYAKDVKKLKDKTKEWVGKMLQKSQKGYEERVSIALRRESKQEEKFTPKPTSIALQYFRDDPLLRGEIKEY